MNLLQRGLGILLGPYLLTACAHVYPDDYSMFVGDWSYRDDCAVYRHYAGVKIQQTVDGATGDWSDGTLAHGSDGSLKGQKQGNTLYVTFCHEDTAPGDSVCPKYGSHESAFERRGNQLVWYDIFSGELREYLVLNPGKDIASNKSTCQEDADVDVDTEAQVTDRDGDGQLTQRDVFLRDYERMRRGEPYVPNHEGAWPPGMTFDFGDSSLKPYTIRVLEHGIQSLKKYPETKFEISGHTDSIESESYDQDLSLRRARAAYEYLISQGIDPSRLKPAGYGASRPISPNTNEDGSDYPKGRAENRRIELNIKD